MLVHVQDQQRHSAGGRHAVVGGRVNDQPLVAGAVGQDHQARAAGQRLAGGRELRLPAIEAAEIAAQRLGEHARRLGRRVAETFEVEFVKQRGIENQVLLTLQFTDGGGRRVGEIELGQLLGKGVQAADRARIFLEVVGDQLGRQPLDLLGIEGERLGAELRGIGGGDLRLRRRRQSERAEQQAGACCQGTSGEEGHGGLLNRHIQDVTPVRKESCAARPVHDSGRRSALPRAHRPAASAASARWARAANWPGDRRPAVRAAGRA